MRRCCSALRPLLGLASVLVCAHASGYCRTTTCSNPIDPPEECATSSHVEDACQKTGAPVFWSSPCLSFSAQYEGSPKRGISGDELERAIRRAFDRWQSIECPGGGSPNVRVDTYPKVACNQQRYNPNGPNQNAWFFQDDHWPYENERRSDIAVTTLVFHRVTGEIYDVDVELNSNARDFVLDEELADEDHPDLMSIVQHESGHVLGLADLHGPRGEDPNLMHYHYAGGADWRSLDEDSAAGICDIYPPSDTPERTCNAMPRAGFTTQCERGGGCSTLPWRAFEADAGGLYALVLGLVGASRRRFHSPRPTRCA